MNVYVHKIVQMAPVNKYNTIYQALCQRGIDRVSQLANTGTQYETRRNARMLLGYVEGHHILPRCMCTTPDEINDIHNLVYLTPREHFICHQLLARMFRGTMWYYKLQHAVSKFLQQRSGRLLSSIQYAVARAASMEANTFQANNRTPETITKISNTMKALWADPSYRASHQLTEHQRILRSISMKASHAAGNRAHTYTDQRSQKISASMTGRCGQLAHRQIGVFHTPMGDFHTAGEAGRAFGVSRNTILKMCITHNNTIIQDVRKILRYWPAAIVGKTPLEQGWAFTPH